jgi:hypothetical protein
MEICDQIFIYLTDGGGWGYIYLQRNLKFYESRVDTVDVNQTELADHTQREA